MWTDIDNRHDYTYLYIQWSTIELDCFYRKVRESGGEFMAVCLGEEILAPDRNLEHYTVWVF